MKFLAFLLAVTLQAATYTVGAGQQFPTINALPAKLLAGDIVEVQAGKYIDVKAWPIAGAVDNPVIVRCVGPGECLFDAGAANLAFTPRAIFEVANGAYHFLGPFYFRNAHNGGLNAAAIRVVSGSIEADGFKIRNCDNGVFSSATATSVTIRNFDIAWSGRGSGAGHSIYAAGAKLVVEDGRFYRTIGGIHVKTRARDAFILRNAILDAVDGEVQCTSGPQTIAPGADCMVEGNTIRTLAKGRANCCRVIAFGHEGAAGTDRNGTLRLHGNKVTMNAPNQILASLDSVNAGLEAVGNDFQGTANLIRVRYGTSGPITGANNRVSPTVIPTPPPAPPGPWSIIDVLPPLFVPPASTAIDTTPPSQVTGLVGKWTATGIELSWTPATDAGGISHYEITAPYGPFGSDEATGFYYYTSQPSITFTVLAVDKSGNRSELPSAPLVVVKP
jgi:hypothetical protein